jgi:zinc protease
MSARCFLLIPVVAVLCAAATSVSNVVAEPNSPPSASIAAKLKRSRTAGWDLISLRTGVKHVVTLRASLPAGDRFAPPENRAIPTLTGALLDKGTSRQSKFSIAEKLEGAGAQISFSVEGTMLQISAKCLGKDLPLLLELLAEQLREPAFAVEEVEKSKRQWTGLLRRQLESTDYRASESFSLLLYPPGHPNRPEPAETFIAAVQAVTSDQLRAFHSEFYGPESGTLVVVGDLDPATVQHEVARVFRGWQGGRRLVPAKAVRISPSRQDHTVVMTDKTSVSVFWGQRTGLNARHEDALPLRVGAAVLGRGFTSRLLSKVRDEEGLTYDIRGGLASDTFSDGEFRITASFAPEMLEQGLASTRRELEAWHRNGITAEELFRVKSDLIGSYKVGLATTAGMAGAILETLHRGYDLGWLDRYSEAVSALSLDRVNQVISSYLDPAQLVLVKAGSIPSPTPPRTNSGSPP